MFVENHTLENRSHLIYDNAVLNVNTHTHRSTRGTIFIFNQIRGGFCGFEAI
jgi:hypothetical protein